MKKLLMIILGVLVVFIFVLIFNTLTFTAKQENAGKVDHVDVDSKAALSRLSQALQIPTISHQDSTKFDTSKIIEFHQFLEKNYPLVHQSLKRQVINDYSLLYKWTGSDTSSKPVAILAHIDVVPIEPGTESKWKYDPFSGAVAEDYVWGRGALDMKSTLTAIMEAAEENQMPASYDGPTKLLFDYIGPEMPFLKKLLFANSWLFEGVIISQLEKITFMNASLRTTTAPTIINGGVKENVLPSQSHALVNFRIRPGNTPGDVIAHAKKVIDNPAVEVAVHGKNGTFPSPVASVDAMGFKLIQKTIGETFKDTFVAPGLMIAGSDTKHYVAISNNNYRHFPIVFGPNDTKLIHGTNERIAAASYIKMIQYNVRLLKNVSM